MLIPEVVGFRLSGELPEGTTATDQVLTVTNMLRSHGVVGRFVEFYGPGVANVPLENRATIGNMSPEYGSTITIFPIDGETLRYLRFTGRPDDLVALVEAYAKEQGLWHDPGSEPVHRDDGPRPVGGRALHRRPARPQDRVPLREAKERFAVALVDSLPEAGLRATRGHPGVDRQHLRRGGRPVVPGQRSAVRHAGRRDHRATTPAPTRWRRT